MVVLCALDGAGGRRADVSPELQAAIRALKSPDTAVRQKAYDLIGDKGDARLIPALIAFRDGRLQDLNGRLVIYGDSVELNGQHRVSHSGCLYWKAGDQAGRLSQIFSFANPST